MIQAIQVLRFHLLELEKVNIINLYILDLSYLWQTHGATCTNSLCFNATDIIKRAPIFSAVLQLGDI